MNSIAQFLNFVLRKQELESFVPLVYAVKEMVAVRLNSESYLYLMLIFCVMLCSEFYVISIYSLR